jgi:hypothetical protein
MVLPHNGAVGCGEDKEAGLGGSLKAIAGPDFDRGMVFGRAGEAVASVRLSSAAEGANFGGPEGGKILSELVMIATSNAPKTPMSATVICVLELF